MSQYSTLYVGMDVHKDTIVVSPPSATAMNRR